jgi:hypothetical protein
MRKGAHRSLTTATTNEILVSFESPALSGHFDTKIRSNLAVLTPQMRSQTPPVEFKKKNLIKAVHNQLPLPLLIIILVSFESPALSGHFDI